MFRLYVKEQLIDLKELTATYRKQLITQNYCLVAGNSPIDHTAAYLAWTETPGTLIILPKIQSKNYISESEQRLLDQAKQFYGQDAMVLTTSGTTAPQSLVAQSRKNVEKITERSAEQQGLDEGCRIGGNLPSFTSGFLNIQLQTAHLRNGELHVWDWLSEACPNITHAVFSAGQLDFAKAKNVNLNLKRLKSVSTGASIVLPRHGEFLLQSGASSMQQIYGVTQLGAPFMTSAFTNDVDELTWLDTDTVKKYSDIRFVNSELQVKNTTISQDQDQYITSDGWYGTGDYWHQTDNKIKFDVRNNEKIKINDYVVKLSEVEEIANQALNLTDCMAVKKSRLGTDFLHLIYQAQEDIKNTNTAKELLGKKLLPHAVPLSFERVDDLPRTALGKKKRW
jgi:hypothetical protein